MKKLLSLVLVVLMLVGCAVNFKKEETEKAPKEFVELKKLSRLDEAQLDQFMADKKTGVVYFGWIDNCGDSLLFQENYFEQFLKDHPDLIDGHIFLFNLDEIAPEALQDKTKRKPFTDKYTVAFSPTLIFVKDGEIVDKVEWTLKTANPFTAIPKEDLDTFFANTGLLK